MSVITISRQQLSYGDEIAASLSSKLGWPLLDREKILNDYLKEITTSYEFNLLNESAKYFLRESRQKCTYLEYVTEKLSDLAQERSFIIMGFGSQMMFAGDPDALHFRIVASGASRTRRAKKLFGVDGGEASVILGTSDKKQRKFVRTLYGADIADPDLYNAIYNTSGFTAQECVSAIISAKNERDSLIKSRRQAVDSNLIHNQSEIPMFKTDSETEFARILDMYQIDWEYEPKTFPIEWDEEGNVTSAFSPDFYLTKFDTYIELTTMDQKYVTEKNRKVKQVKKLYPGTHIRVVYKKDFHSLVERFKS